MPKAKEGQNAEEAFREEDVGDLFWAEKISGIPCNKLAALSKKGEIPGAFRLTNAIDSWRFEKVKFLRWLKEKINSIVS